MQHSEDGDRSTAARFALSDPSHVREFIERMVDQGGIENQTRSSPWTFTFGGYIPEQERLRETLCSVGNGYRATRGCAPEADAGPLHYPGTYAAGLYNRLTDEIAGVRIENESLVDLCPNWLCFQRVPHRRRRLVRHRRMRSCGLSADNGSTARRTDPGLPVP